MSNEWRILLHELIYNQQKWNGIFCSISLQELSCLTQLKYKVSTLYKGSPRVIIQHIISSLSKYGIIYFTTSIIEEFFV